MLRPACVLRPLALLTASACLDLTVDATPAAVSYVWRNVAIGGGGFVTGIEFHPAERDLIYARTDVGGAYRWDAGLARWEPLLDWVGRSDWNLQGVESLAVDPTDPDRIYLAVGTYTFPDAPLGEILRSADRGRTWRRSVLPFKFGANEAGRGSGERLLVDAAQPSRLYLGTRRDGLWRSLDRGASWTRLAGFPEVPDGSADYPPNTATSFNYLAQPVGIIWIKAVPPTAPGRPPTTTTGNDAPTRRLYAAVSTARESVFASTDAGETWSPVPEQPVGLRPTGAALGSDGRLWITYADEPGPNGMRHGALWSLDLHSGAWAEHTPESPTLKSHPGYAAVAVDPADPRTVVVTTWMRGSTGEELFRTTDGGLTWRGMLATATWDHSSAPYTGSMRPHWMSDVEFDPLDRGRLLFNTGYGLWQTRNALAFDAGQTSRWEFFVRNLEETVPLVLVSPPAGAHLLSGLGDVDGFVHHDFTASPPGGRFNGPRLKNTEWMDYAGLAPGVLVRSGTTYQSDRIHALYTLDGGATWAALATEPPHAPDPRRPHPVGPVGLSADGRTASWTLLGERPHFTDDWGASWRGARGAPTGLWAVGDRVDPTAFYGYDLGAGALYLSTDRGASFQRIQAGLPVVRPRSWGFTFVETDATPGHAGDGWLVVAEQLYHYSNYGRRIERWPGLAQVGSVGLGAPPPGSDYPAIFVIAKIGGVDGIYRSDDRGATWIRLTDDAYRYGSARGLTGDPRIFGRVYFCTGGRGIVYGEPR